VARVQEVRPPRFVLSTSCELPPRANADCVTWLMDCARDYGRYERIFATQEPPTPV
jgi:uroporphyrinogen-III decarboxylase